MPSGTELCVVKNNRLGVYISAWMDLRSIVLSDKKKNKVKFGAYNQYYLHALKIYAQNQKSLHIL